VQQQPGDRNVPGLGRVSATSRVSSATRQQECATRSAQQKVSGWRTAGRLAPMKPVLQAPERRRASGRPAAGRRSTRPAGNTDPTRRGETRAAALVLATGRSPRSHSRRAAALSSRRLRQHRRCARRNPAVGGKGTRRRRKLALHQVTNSPAAGGACGDASRPGSGRTGKQPPAKPSGMRRSRTRGIHASTRDWRALGRGAAQQHATTRAVTSMRDNRSPGGRRHGRQRLAVAEADLDMHRRAPAEQRREIERARGRRAVAQQLSSRARFCAR